MFEKEIIAISDYSVNKIKKLGAYFTVEQLNSTDLHPAIKRYIDSELDYLIFLDRKELVQKSAFDYSKPEIVKYFSLINSEIKNGKKISFEDAKNLIIQAVSFTANFLVRPKWSLTKFIYNEDQLKTIDEISLSLNYLYYYDYLKKVLKAFIEKKRSLNFSLIDFEVALNKIDKELFSKQSQGLIDNALFSIADFFSMGGIDPNKISTNCVELFLKEKDLIDQLFRLRRALPVNARQYYTLNEIRHIIHTPTSLDKSEQLPSKTDKEEERIFEKPKDEKVDESKPEAKIEKKKEITQEEMFDFDKEVENEADDKSVEAVPGVEKEIPEEENVISDEQGKTPEEQNEIPEQQNEIQEKPKEVSEEEENEVVIDDNTNEVKEEKIEDDLDSLLDEESLSEYSSDDELLDAFDSQLKALEEESDMLLTDDENSTKEIGPQEQVEKEESYNEGEETEKKEEPKIILETNEQNELDNNISEAEITEEERDKVVDNKPIIEEPQKEIKKEDKKLHQRAPQRASDLFGFMSNKEIEKIVINVFNEDREDFANTMEKITECFNYDEATDILKAVFFSYRVNPYTRDAVILTNAVSNYFNQAT